MSGVVSFGKAETPSYAREGSDSRRYDVLVDGVKVGTVESHRTESWRKSGRLRSSYIGSPKEWSAHVGGRRVADGHSSRQSAVESLLRQVPRP